MVSSQTSIGLTTRLSTRDRRPGHRAGCWAVVVALVIGLIPLSAQTKPPVRRAPATPPKPAAKPPEPKVEPAMMMCPQPLGVGVQTKQLFCDVLIGRDPANGIIITLPPHSGQVTLTFDLHNRHIYSEELVKQNRSYRRYTASIGVLAMDNTLLSRAAVQNEFRNSADIVDRILGSGPGGFKAVVPTGKESVSIMIDAQEQKVSILGEKLAELRPDGSDEFSSVGRPVAIISNVMVQYQPPAPARRPAATPRR